jgi:hypothetical protein
MSDAEIRTALDNTWRLEKRAAGRWVALRGPLVIGRFGTRKQCESFMGGVAAAYRQLRDRPTLLTDRPHPKLPRSQFTARDYASFLLDNATSISGIRRALRMIVETNDADRPHADNVIPFRPRGAA